MKNTSLWSYGKRIQVYIGNILSNALRYANTFIEIKCMKTQNTTKIQIFNDWDKISKESIPHIFERFYTGNKGNTGIGLSMASDIIKHHNGTIDVKNKDNGVSFIIQLPI